MKIALIRKNYNPYGGAENYLKLIAKGLKARGHDIYVYSSAKWPEGLFITRKIDIVSKPSFISDLLFAKKIARALKKDFFDCVLSFERIPFQDACPVGIKDAAGIPNLVYRAGDGCHREWLNKRRTAEPLLKNLSFAVNPHHRALLYLEKKCFFNSKKIIANSMMVKGDIVRHYGIPEDKILVIYNGVDLGRFQPVTAERKTAAKNSLGIKEDKIILFVGADFKRKGLAALLKAFSYLDLEDVRLVAAGKEETSQYLRIAEKLGIDKKVSFWGTEREIEKLYEISDVFVLPTIYDPFSNATLEAMASGLPVITTSCNGAAELIEDGIHGFAVKDPLDARVLADKISAVIKKSEEMGQRARAKAEDYPIDRAVEKIIKVISGDGG